MKELVISKNDIYKIDEIEYFKFNDGDGYTYRDIYVDLEKNNRYILNKIAILCELKHKGLNKKNLIDLIEKSNCLKIV